MVIQINPKRLVGDVVVPPSKSVAHRAIIFASFASGVSNLFNVDMSDDVNVTIDCVRALGARVEHTDDGVTVDGTQFLRDGGQLNLDCGESGSTLRFFLPIALLRPPGSITNFISKGNLSKRPMGPLFELFSKIGVSYHVGDKISIRSLNLSTIDGKKGVFEIGGEVTSQFITGLLMMLTKLKNTNELLLSSPLQSCSYVDLTIQTGKKFGIDIVNKEYKKFIVNGQQLYRSADFRIEGDYSQAAFWLVGNVLGCEINCLGLDEFTNQGDKAIMDIISSNNREIDATDIPDLVPILAVLFSLSQGRHTIYNAARLRLKESDRLASIKSELTKLGAKIIEGDDYLIIDGVESFSGGEVYSHNDHRVAMALAIAATRARDKVIINDAECVNKSYPNFWRDYNKLLGREI